MKRSPSGRDTAASRIADQRPTTDSPQSDERRPLADDYWHRFWQAHAAATQDADPHVQVLRTQHKQPISAATFAAIVASIQSHLDVQPHHTVLDLCCGNGLITRHLAGACGRVVAVDFAGELLEHAWGDEPAEHLELVQSDARKCDFPPQSFDRILIYAALQYFTEPEVVDLCCRLKQWLKPAGRVFLGDIPDVTRRWEFFDSPERRAAYFQQLQAGTPIIGTWFDPRWLEAAGLFAGFREARVCTQSAALPFHRFRYDLLLET